MSFKDVRIEIYALINFLEQMPAVCELIETLIIKYTNQYNFKLRTYRNDKDVLIESLIRRIPNYKQVFFESIVYSSIYSALVIKLASLMINVGQKIIILRV